MFSFHRKPPPPFLSAVIVAAGESSRMNGIDKQLAQIGGIPAVIRSAFPFEDSPLVAEIVLVCRGDQIPEYYRLIQEYDLEKVTSVVGGGEHRQESVFRGIDACDGRADYYAIHDGARPLVTDWEIERCTEAAMRFGAAAVGTPVKDTIKVCGADGFIQSTPDRERLVTIRTPQIFAAGLYRGAMERAKAAHRVYTDDCQLVEQCGHPVAVSMGGYENIKITTPEDIAMAETILAFRGQGDF